MIEPFVSQRWLTDHVDEVDVVDVRWALGGPPGGAAFESGHLPSAVFCDLDADLAAPASASAGRHPMPTARAFAESMSRLGVDGSRVVVAYDDSAGSSAARLVWMLRWIGVESALLDGGLRGWVAEHGSTGLHTGPNVAVPVAFEVRPWPEHLLVAADALIGLAESGVPVLDARDHGRFTGAAPAAVDARAGHVPGARSAPWADNLTDDGLLREAQHLAEHYALRGVGADASEDPERTPVVYCGSGVTACLDLLALERVGVRGARLYAGSWSQWAADPSRPVATGP